MPPKLQRFISGKLPKLRFVDSHIVATHNKLLFSVMKVKGAHITVANVEDINDFDNLWHSIVTGLNEEFGLYGHVFRRKVGTEFTVGGYSEFTRAFNQKYQAKYKNAELYQNEIYITLVYTGLNKFEQKVKSLFSKKALEQSNDSIQDGTIKLNNKLQEVQTMLGKVGIPKTFQADVLDQYGGEFSQILSFFGSFVNGLDIINYAYPVEAMLGHHGVSTKFSKYPYGNLSEFIPQAEISFADKKYLSFKQNDQVKFAGMVAIKNYGSRGTTPVSFDRLLHLNTELLVTVSFFPFNKNKSEYKVGRIANKHEMAGDKGISQQMQLGELEDDIASERVTLGNFHNSIMVLGDDIASVNSKCNEVIKLYAEIGFRAIVEGINHKAMFWAQFPCNQKYITRPRLCTSAVFAHFFPLHNYPTGHNGKTHLGEAICLVDTPSKTPFWFNYAGEGSGKANEFCAAHSLIVGSNGFGKTVMLLSLDALQEKYHMRTFFFDYEFGAYAYFKATDNPYLVYQVNTEAKIKHNPFLLPDTLETRKFCIDWLCILVKLPSEDEIDQDIRKFLEDCVFFAFSIPKEQRTLSAIFDNRLPHNFPRWTQLNQFLRANYEREDGIYCEFFDNSEDNLNIDSYKVAFEMSKLIENPRLKTALLKYIFYRIELSRANHNDPISIILDEGWYYLDDQLWIEWFRREVPTLRKKR